MERECILSGSPKKNGVSVKIEKHLLPACKATNVHSFACFDAHSLKGRVMGNGRD